MLSQVNVQGIEFTPQASLDLFRMALKNVHGTFNGKDSVILYVHIPLSALLGYLNPLHPISLEGAAHSRCGPS